MSDVSCCATNEIRSMAGLCAWLSAGWLKRVCNVQATTRNTITVMATMISHHATPMMSATRPLAAMQRALRGHSTLYTARPLMTRPFRGRATLNQHLLFQPRKLRRQRTGVKAESSSEGAGPCLTCNAPCTCPRPCTSLILPPVCIVYSMQGRLLSDRIAGCWWCQTPSQNRCLYKAWQPSA